MCLLVVSCQQVSPDIALRNELVDTSWRWDRTEVQEADGTFIRTLEQPDSCLALADFTFREDRQFIFNPACLEPDWPLTCGNWEVQEEALSVLYTNFFIVPDFCELANGTLLFYELQMPFELTEQELRIDHPFVQNELLTASELTGFDDGSIIIRSYYTPAPLLEFDEEEDCCLDETFPN